MPLTKTEVLIACEKEKQAMIELRVLAAQAKTASIIAKRESSGLLAEAKLHCAKLDTACAERKLAAIKLELQLEIKRFQAK